MYKDFSRNLIELVSNIATGSKEMTDEFGYKCIPRNLNDVADIGIFAKNLLANKKSITICDFGCGFGASLMALNYFSSDVKLIGIEFRKEYEQPFNMLLPRGKFIHKDLNEVTIDFIKNLKIDIGYIYEPIRYHDKEKLLETKIVKSRIPIIIGINRIGKTEKELGYKDFWINNFSVLIRSSIFK